MSSASIEQSTRPRPRVRIPLDREMVYIYIEDMDPTGESRLEWTLGEYEFRRLSAAERERLTAEVRRSKADPTSSGYLKPHHVGADVIVELQGHTYCIWIDEGRVERLGGADRRDHNPASYWRHFSHIGDAVPLSDPRARRAVELAVAEAGYLGPSGTARAVTWTETP